MCSMKMSELILDDQLKDAFRIARKVWLYRPTVNGIDIGYKYRDNQKTHELAIRVYVQEKLASRYVSEKDTFPSSIRGVPIDIIQAQFKQLHSLQPERKQAMDLICGGISIAHYSSLGAGTLGTIVYDANDNTPYLLSNWHVLASNGRVGDPILQPAPSDGGEPSLHTVGTLKKWMINEYADAAIAELNNTREYSSTLYDTGVSLTHARYPQMNEVLKKSGRSTGVTESIVDGIGTYVVALDGVGYLNLYGFKLGTLDINNQWDDEISTFGDSGSVIYSEADHAGVGLLVAGEESPHPMDEHAIACFLPDILAEFNVTMSPREN